jgi:N-acetylmuramoyl-L-alanine amidase
MTSAGSVALPPPPVSRAEGRRSRPPIIVVDAGHGGPDRGMRGPIGARRPIEEASITLAVARQLREALRERGAQVIMTRSTDTLIALRDRGRIANRAGADLFLSIHVNAANPRWRDPRAARGVETYFLSDAKTEDERRVAEMENDALKYDVGVDAAPGDPFSFMMADMEQNEYLRESSELAASIQRGLSAMHPGGDRGVKQAGFAVLVTAHMPAALVEIGFGTNAAEAAYLSSASEQQRIARAIARATMEYFAEYDGRRTSARARTQ